MKKPSYSLSSRLMLVTHLTQESPAQPGATRRNGNPCEDGNGAPFMWKASRVSGCRAFSSGTVRTKSGTLPMGTSAPLNRTWVAPDFTPARFRTSARRTPVQRALPTAPHAEHMEIDVVGDDVHAGGKRRDGGGIRQIDGQRNRDAECNGQHGDAAAQFVRADMPPHEGREDGTHGTMRPSCMRIVRSHTAAASALWVAMRIACPLSASERS